MSNIEWTDATWNPVVGCTPVSPGCLNCYAATMAVRLEAMGQKPYVGLTVKGKGAKGQRDRGTKGSSRAVFNGTVRMLPERLTEPLRWRKPRMVFVDSMSDLFHEDVPFEFIDRVRAVMLLCEWHTFQVLTKRTSRMALYCASERDSLVARAMYEMVKELPKGHPAVARYRQISHAPLPRAASNIWLGTSVEDQVRADERIPHLLRCPAAVRFLSVEPLLGPVDLKLGSRGNDLRTRAPYIGWVIVGGESGPGARPCNVEWIESIVTQCKAAGVPVFVKQLGARPEYTTMKHYGGRREQLMSNGGPLRDRKGGDPAEWSERLRVREWPRGFVPAS